MLGHYRQLVGHLKRVHNKTVREYKIVHDDLKIIDKVRHNCQICSKDFLYTWDHLQEHLKLDHAMKVGEYVDNYLDKEDTDPVKLIRSKDDCKTTRCKETLKEEEGLCKNKTEAQDKAETKTIGKNGNNSSVDEPSPKERYSSRPHDYCVYSCEDCNFSGTHISYIYFCLQYV